MSSVAKDLRTYLRILAERPGELVTVTREVDPVLELTAIVEKLESQQRYPGVLFTRVRGSQLPVLINAMASAQNLALSLGMDLETLEQEYARREANPLPLRYISREEAPVKEVIWRDQEVDLERLPIIQHNELDAGKYIGSAVTICKDRNTGAVNMGIYRHQLQGRDQLGLMINPSHHGNYVRLQYEEHDEPMEVALALGHHPALFMAAVSKIPGIGGEMEVAGGLMEEPLEVVPGETVDLPVPAHAEIVIEGYVPPHQRHHEGPYGEWPRYYTKEGQQPFIKVTAITMRHDAIFQDLFNAHAEHLTLGAIPRLGSLYRRIKEVVPRVKAVNLPLSGNRRAFCYISLHKQAEGEPKQAAFAAFATETDIKHVIVVDDDIDVFNETEVLWALATRFQADRDLVVIPNAIGGHLNPSAYGYDRMEKGVMETKLIMDATKPLPPYSFPKKVEVPKELVKRVDLASVLVPFEKAHLGGRI